MPTTTRDFELSDGRLLDVLVGSGDSRSALVCHHGTPSDSTLWIDWDDVAREHGLLLVSISRPGYATSERMQGRIVGDVASDVEEILDLLGLDTFVTAGWSGGGPHALACGALLPERCRAVATLAGVGPYGRADLDFLAGMGPENHEEFGAAREGEASLRAYLDGHGETMRHVTGPEIAEAFGGLVPQVDKDALVGGFADLMAANMRRALAPGFDGWIDDDFVFINPWGFEPEDLMVPVTIWQGDLDLMVPFAHGKWLAAHILNSRAKLVPGHGHISLMTAYRTQIVEDLVEQAHA